MFIIALNRNKKLCSNKFYSVLNRNPPTFGAGKLRIGRATPSIGSAGMKGEDDVLELGRSGPCPSSAISDRY